MFVRRGSECQHCRLCTPPVLDGDFNAHSAWNSIREFLGVTAHDAPRVSIALSPESCMVSKTEDEEERRKSEAIWLRSRRLDHASRRVANGKRRQTATQTRQSAANRSGSAWLADYVDWRPTARRRALIGRSAARASQSSSKVIFSIFLFPLYRSKIISLYYLIINDYFLAQH